MFVLSTQSLFNPRTLRSDIFVTIATRLDLSKTAVSYTFRMRTLLEQVLSKRDARILSSTYKQQRVLCWEKLLHLYKANRGTFFTIDSNRRRNSGFLLWSSIKDEIHGVEIIGWSTTDKSQSATINEEDYGNNFWDSQGILTIDIKPRNTTANWNYYASHLYKSLDEIKKKRHGILSRKVHLLQDNAQSIYLSDIKEAITKCGH